MASPSPSEGMVTSTMIARRRPRDAQTAHRGQPSGRRAVGRWFSRGDGGGGFVDMSGSCYGAGPRVGSPWWVPSGPMSRLCSRPGCATAASATMAYDYVGRTVWLDDLEPEADPNHYDLCPSHADRLRVPQGW